MLGIRAGKFVPGIAAVAACITLALGLTACGGKQSSAASPQLSDRNDGSQATEELVSQSLDQTLTELGEMECPEGVDEELWAELKDALGKALNDSCRAGIYPRRSATGMDGGGHKWPPYSGHSMLCPYKIASAPPTGEANRIDDLAITDNGDGTFALSWHYRNLGDYDQDGVVAVEDIIPLAEHFGETYETEDTNCVQAVIDGSGNGRIGIEDITPIAMNFAVEVEHYAVEGAAEEAGAYEPVSEVAQDAGTGEGRLEYSTIIESPAELWHRVVPVDSEGASGEASNAVLRPSNEPIIYGVSSTEGYQHEEYTFSATVTGVESLEYAWDFGGGATPDTSSETSPTVTLADAGEYQASLTVTNADGSATFPFTLTISERDMWAHTWGREGSESIKSIAVDDNGDVYLAGITSVRCLILKYSSEGNLLWAKLWGGDSGEYFTGVHMAPDGAIYATGMTDSFGQGHDDALLVKYDAEGTLLWAKTWGTAAGYERIYGMDVDAEGNIYICGDVVVWGGKADILLVKLSPEGDAIWARTWGGNERDRARDVLVTSEGVYVCGYTDSFSASENDAVLIKYSTEGEFCWARTFGGAEGDGFQSITGDEGNIYVAGNTASYGVGDRDALIMKWDSEGNVLWVRTWGDVGSRGLNDIIVVPSGSVIGAGATNRHDPENWDVLLLSVNTDGDILWGKVWNSPNRNAAYALEDDLDGSLFICGEGINAAGEWMDVEGTLSIPDLTIGAPEGTSSPIEGIVSVAEGTENEPEGVLDSGGGKEDALLIKNYPR